MTIPTVLAQYESRLPELHACVAQARFHSSIALLILLATTGASLVLGAYAVSRQAGFWWPSLPVPIIFAAARRYKRQQKAGAQKWRLARFYEHAAQRLRGDWVGNGAAGEEFADPDHVYSGDLDIFGTGSLFELLCTARTAAGKRGLARFLLEAPDREESRLRQDAVKELRDRQDLREHVALLGGADTSDSKWETFAGWLEAPEFRFSPILRTVALVTSSCVALIIFSGAAGLIPWIRVAAWLLPFAVFHSIVGGIFRKRVNLLAEWVRPVSVETQVLREGLELLASTPFQSARLRELGERVHGAAKSVRSLERLLNALRERNKEWFYSLSLLLLAGTQLSMAIESWRIAHREALAGWLDAWAEFEALMALAGYAYENPENMFPEFTGDGPVFEGEALGHPLVPAEVCVRNDVRLNGTCRFYLISGSNMSGKSTLLRSIGLNAVLAMAGAPVPARALRLSRLSVCASLAVVDSLLRGKSKFLAEMDRLRETIETATAGQPVLFLIDEILSGTNSRDRRAAAEAVTRTLLSHGAIGALSTHDLALTEIAEFAELHGRNVHMGSRTGGGPLDFDYLLKPGVTQEGNALAIARLAGVPV